MTVPTTDSQMYQTMHGQPEAVRRLLAEGWEPAAEAAAMIAGAERVWLAGIGTSYHAALVSGWLLRAAGATAQAVTSFDFARYPEHFPIGPNDAAIVFAHTGVKSYSGESLARAVASGATVLSVGSLAAEHPGSHLVLRTVEREKSAAYTASHLAAMTSIAQVATVLGERTGTATAAGFREALTALPDHVADVLRRQEEIEPIAQLAATKRTYATGAGPNEATALELVIKAREAAHAQIDALAAEQFLHGPLVAVNEGDLAVVVQAPGAAAERVGAIAAVLAAIGAELWVVGQAIGGLPQATIFTLPELPEPISPLLAVVPMQILAYQTAALKGIHPDTFRRDDPRYAEAFGLLKL